MNMIAVTELGIGELALRAIGLALLSGMIATVAAYGFRRYTREELPEGAALLLGFGAVAIYLNTRLVLVQFLGGESSLVSIEAAAINISFFLIAGVTADGGRRLGDSVALSAKPLPTSFQSSVSPFVRATGRSISVTLPEADTIADIDGYDPVTEETKATLAGQTFVFGRGMTVDELKSQLGTRLKDDADVGYVDVEIETDGTVSYLGLGRRPAGLGPTLQPGMDATAIRADPAFSASPGDSVQIWQSGEDGERVGSAELRAAVGPVATVVADETVASTLDPSTTYRLMTLPSDSNPEREFAGMLRRADETLSVVTVEPGSQLVGLPVGGLDVTLIAIRTGAADIETIPSRDRLLSPGEELFALGKPSLLRQLEAAATGSGDTHRFTEADADPVPSPADPARDADRVSDDNVRSENEK